MTTSATKTAPAQRFTPGPWSVEENVSAGGVTHLAITNRDDINWMPCSITPMSKVRPTDRANARLIAAAPALYDALRVCVQFIDEQVPHECWRNGITAPGGTIDEGEFLTQRMVNAARAALVLAESEEQPA